MKTSLILTLLLGIGSLFGQQAIGLRFASNVHFFPRAKDYALVGNAFTTGVFGVYYNNYKPNSGFEVGLNVNYKDANGKGFPNLPIVMRDYGKDETQNVGFTGLEMDLKVGPRFGYFYPKIGYILGYRLTQTGFQLPGVEEELNPWYLMLPFGGSVNLPTRYGSVGFGSFFNVGLFNVLRDPNPGDGNLYDGGRQRFITFEITVNYQTRE
jgi:hypothetical protein